MPMLPIFSSTFSIEPFYHEGHTATLAEADTLNQVFYSRAMVEASKIAKTLGRAEGKPLTHAQTAFLEEQLQQWAQSFVLDYQPLRVVSSPEHREAQAMAKKKIFEVLNSRGIDPNLVPATELSNYISKYISSHPELLDAARAKLHQKRLIAEAVVGSEDE